MTAVEFVLSSSPFHGSLGIHSPHAVQFPPDSFGVKHTPPQPLAGTKHKMEDVDLSSHSTAAPPSKPYKRARFENGSFRAAAAAEEQQDNKFQSISYKPDLDSLIEFPKARGAKRSKLDDSTGRAMDLEPAPADTKELGHKPSSRAAASLSLSTQQQTQVQRWMNQQLDESPFGKMQGAVPPTVQKKDDHYTKAQVKEMVSAAVTKAREEMEVMFNQRLNELLGDQFQVFSTYNRDYVSRQLRRSENNDHYS